MSGDEVFEETALRYASSLSDQLGHWGLATAVLFVLAGALALWPRRSLPGWLPLATVLPICGLAVLHAWQLRWIGDDAFISFRYSRNLVEGSGLVFNDGARVEGYTNFLWTVMLAGAMALGFNPGQVALVLSLASLAACCVLASHMVRRYWSHQRSMVVSLAALMLAANYTFASYGTSGLETMFAALLVLVAVERADSKDLLSAGSAGILATLAHPDHSLFYAALALVLLLRERPLGVLRQWLRREGPSPQSMLSTALARPRGNLIGYAAPFVLLYVPYFVWRTLYYGDWFPNTYYAKSGSEWYFGQGVKYLWISLVSGGIWVCLPFALLGMWSYRKTLLGQFAALAVPLYLLYVAKIGGDFMLGRLLFPVLPVLFILAELGLRELLVGSVARRVVGMLGVPLFALSLVPALVIRPNEKFYHVADERTFYELKSFSPLVVDADYTAIARALNKAFENASRPPVLGMGCVGIVGYETDMPTFDYWGLTEPSVAKMKLKERGRPGHEKLASLGHAVAGGTDFADVETFPEPYLQHTVLRFEGRKYWLVKYDAELLGPLRSSGAINVRNFESWVRRWRPPSDAARLRCDAWFMSQFYFEANSRSRVERGKRHVSRFLRASVPEGLIDWVLLGRSPSERGFRELSRYSFENQLAGWRVSGTALAGYPTHEKVPGQDQVYGNQGAYLNTYTLAAGDEALGTLRSPSFELNGDAITFKVGGGMNDRRLRVRLEVDGKTVEAATGCNSELMYRWAWDVRGYRGRQAQLVIEDLVTGRWGHLLVDEIAVWERIEQPRRGRRNPARPRPAPHSAGQE